MTGVQREWSPNARKVAVFTGPDHALRGFISLHTPVIDHPHAACTWIVTDQEGNTHTSTGDYLEAESSLLTTEPA